MRSFDTSCFVRRAVWPCCALFCCALWARPEPAWAKNPFLHASSDDRALATFSGTEWGDEIGKKDLPLSCKVVTVRVGHFTWGDAYLISFESVKSQTGKPRALPPLLFVATDREIIFVNTDRPSEAVEKLKPLSAPPKYDQADLVGLASGSKTYKETALSVAKIQVKGDVLRYTRNHKSGHFLILEWKKGIGLTEYSQNRGARSDGFRLRR